MNVAARAISLPHVSAMTSRVSACVDVSIPLFTKINRGRFSPTKLGRSLIKVSLAANRVTMISPAGSSISHLSPWVGIANKTTSIC